MKVRHKQTGVEYEAEQVTSEMERHGTLHVPKGGWKLTLNGVPAKFAPSDAFFRKDYETVRAPVVKESKTSVKESDDIQND